MEIQECSLPGFYCSRIFGLAPYLMRRNSKNRIDEIRRSPWLCLYSICFLIITVSLTIRFIFIDANSKIPIRMRTATTKFVTIFNVCVVVSTCLCGAITGLIGYKYTQYINRNLNNADDDLELFNDQKKDKKRNTFMVVIVFSTLTTLLILDGISKWRTADKSRTSADDAIEIESSVPFYILFFILMALHVQLAQTALGIQRRYQRLNSAIRDMFSINKPMDSGIQLKPGKIDTGNSREAMEMEFNDETPLPGSNIYASAKSVTKIKTLSRGIQKENTEANLFGAKKCSATLSTASFGKLKITATALTRATFFLNRLSCTHAILGETVSLVSKAFGMTILIMLGSCLLHIIATSYFLFINLFGDPDWFNVTLQLLWCCFHILRLLLIVEPCHLATLEASKTITIIGGAIRYCQDSEIEPILRRFWRQLLTDDTYYFTARGLCTIDRQILTSIVAAITMYLVILIQFQKSDA